MASPSFERMQPEWIAEVAGASAAPNAEKMIVVADAVMRQIWYGGDITTSTTPGCCLKAHAPIYGIKPGKDKTTPILHIQKTIAGGFMKVAKFSRRDVEIAIHPDGSAISVFETVSGHLKCCPCCNLMVQPLIMVMKMEDDGNGVLKACEVHELAAKTPLESKQLLVEKLGWPSDTQYVSCSSDIGAR